MLSNHIIQIRDRYLQLAELIKEPTENKLFLELKKYFLSIDKDESVNISNEELEKLLLKSKELLNNLKHAKAIVEKVQNKFHPTNRDVMGGLEKQQFRQKQIEALESMNDQINAEIISIFKKMKDVRNDSIFEQTAHQKGKGVKIMLINHFTNRVLSPSKFPLPKGCEDPFLKNGNQVLGNCDEQSSDAFHECYLIVKNAIQDGKSAPIISHEKIEVKNQKGGHVYVMVGRDKRNSFPSEASEVLAAGNELGSICVVIDPWDKENPFYPASDIANKMTSLGRYGTSEIVFGLDYDIQNEEIAEPKDRNHFRHPLF